MRDYEQIANKVAKDIERLEVKHKCKLGVWLTWRDLENNLKIMRDTPNFDEAHFAINIRFENGIDDKT